MEHRAHDKVKEAFLPLSQLVNRDLKLWAADNLCTLKDFIGENVMVAGLKTAAYNGKFASITSVEQNGRVGIKFLSQQKQSLSVLPEKLWMFTRCACCKTGDHFAIGQECPYCEATWN